MDNILHKLAFLAIKEEFDGKNLIDKSEILYSYPALSNNGAVFVTLQINSQLRGCIGSLVATRSLLDDIIYHAKNAAFHDPRFLPLSEDEFSKVDIELSILSKPLKITYKDIEDLKQKIKPNIHGVILQKNSKSATFLPQVWEQLTSFDMFFSHLCQKAGLNQTCLEQKPEIFTYTVRKIKK